MSRRDLLVLGQRVPGDLKAAIENVEKAVLSNGPLMQDEKEQLPAAIQGICDILKKNSDPMVLARAASCAGTLAHVRRKHREELVDRGMVSSLLAMCAPRTTGAPAEHSLFLHEYASYAMMKLTHRNPYALAAVVENDGFSIMADLAKSHRSSSAHVDCCHLHHTGVGSLPPSEDMLASQKAMRDLTANTVISAKLFRLSGDASVRCQLRCGRSSATKSQAAFAVELYDSAGASLRDQLAGDGLLWAVARDSCVDSKSMTSLVNVSVERVMEDGLHMWLKLQPASGEHHDGIFSGMDVTQEFPCSLHDAVPHQPERLRTLQYAVSILGNACHHRQSYSSTISEHAEFFRSLFVLPDLEICNQAVTCTFHIAGLPAAAHEMSGQGVLEDLLDLCQRGLPCLPDSTALVFNCAATIQRIITHCNACRYRMCIISNWPVLAQALQLVPENHRCVFNATLKYIVGGCELQPYLKPETKAKDKKVWARTVHVGDSWKLNKRMPTHEEGDDSDYSPIDSESESPPSLQDTQLYHGNGGDDLSQRRSLTGISHQSRRATQSGDGPKPTGAGRGSGKLHKSVVLGSAVRRPKFATSGNSVDRLTDRTAAVSFAEPTRDAGTAAASEDGARHALVQDCRTCDVELYRKPSPPKKRRHKTRLAAGDETLDLNAGGSPGNTDGSPQWTRKKSNETGSPGNTDGSPQWTRKKSNETGSPGNTDGSPQWTRKKSNETGSPGNTDGSPQWTRKKSNETGDKSGEDPSFRLLAGGGNGDMYGCISVNDEAGEFPAMDARFYNTDEVVSKSVLAAMPEKYLNSTSVASEEWATKIQTMSRDIRATYNPMDEYLLDSDRFYTLGSTVNFRSDLTHELNFFEKCSLKKFREPMARHSCAFLNTGKGGTIYFGIDSSGLVHGITLTRKTRDDFRLLLDQLMHQFKPVVSAHLFSVEFVACVDPAVKISDSMRKAIDDVFVIEVKMCVARGSMFVTPNDMCFLRYDDKSKQLSMDDVRKHVQAQQEVRYLKEIEGLQAELKFLRAMHESRTARPVNKESGYSVVWDPLDQQGPPPLT